MTAPQSLLAGLLLLLLHAAPDEGQWLPQQFLDRDWSELKARGLVLTKDELWHPTEGGVLSAAVQIGGCSASFVSGEGLLVTNHHCGFGAIQRLSTLERNLVEEGFVAPSRKEEVPAPGMVVYVVRRIEDVTARVHAAQAKARTDLERHELVEAETRKIIEEAERSEEHTTCHVASFLNGRTYHLYYRTRIPDVRLVYAPPRSIGEFGGDEDNWMWPRHTGDFTFFRAYVGKDGQPAAPSPDNVPYRPKHWLRVSKEGVKPGDLVMVLGYPGRTERYLTSAAVKARQEGLYPFRLEMLTGVLRILEEAGRNDPERALRLSAVMKSVSNVQKNSLGMVKGLPRNQVVARKLREEAELRSWIAADPERTARYGSLLDELLAFDAEEGRYLAHDDLLNAMFRYLPLVGSLTDAIGVVAAREREPVDGETAVSEREWRMTLQRMGSPNLTRELDAIERPMLAFLLDLAHRELDPEIFPVLSELLGDDMGAAELAEAALATTRMTDAEARRRLIEQGMKAIEASDDPIVRLARGLAADRERTGLRSRNAAGKRLVIGNLWIEAQEKWRGSSFYPDANGTLRISVATVKGYDPQDGVRCLPQTTLSGVVAKERGEEPFKSPAALLEAAGAPDLGRFEVAELGDVPVCFLSDADTTGGNSGSPVINGKGELVGLNFDRVFENVAGDFGWNAPLSRNISVDIRYVGWILDKVLPAPRLLEELGFGG